MAIEELIQTFFDQGHVLLLLVVYLALDDLLRFRHLPGECSRVFTTEIRRRVFVCLEPFFPGSLSPMLFVTLKQCRGIITDAVVRQFFLLNTEDMPAPTTLTVIIPPDSLLAMHAFMHTAGYAPVAWDPHSREVYGRDGHDVVIRKERFRHPGHGTDTEKFVAILISKREALSVLLSADNTADMVAISHDTIVSYYPGMTLANKGLMRNWDASDSDDGGFTIETESEGISLSFGNSHWTKPCGAYCPEIWRCPYDDEGAMKIHWDGLPHEPLTLKATAWDSPEVLGWCGWGGGWEIMDDTMDDAMEGGSNRLAEGDGNTRTTEAQATGEGDLTDEAQDMGDQATGEGDLTDEAQDMGEDLTDEAQDMGEDLTDEAQATGEGDITDDATSERRGRAVLGPDFTLVGSEVLGPDFTFAEILEWRLDSHCRNTHCRNGALHDIRALFVTL